jgi:glycosyltransferase involved in cell wall biosynthesis
MSSRKINILHIIDKLSMDGINPSSCTILFGEWIPQLDSNGFRTSVLTLKKPDIAGEYLEKRGIRLYYQGFGKISHKNIRAINDLIEVEKTDIVHLHGYSAANFGRIAARKKRIKNIVHEHAVLNVQPHQYIADYLLRNHTDLAIAVSNSVKEFMIKGRSVPEEKIQVVFNGIKLDKFKKITDESIINLKSTLSIDKYQKVVGTITRLRKEKGNKYFLQAIPLILKKYPNTVFLIIGDGPLRGEMEKMVIDLNISPQVKFLGFRNDVTELLSILDINVIPSLSEGFGLSMVEAMAVGNAIVATAVGGHVESGVDGENVLFVPPKTPSEITQKVCYYFENPEFSKKCSLNAEKSSKKFDVRTNAKIIGEQYAKIVEDK